MPALGIHFKLGVDGISLLLVLLTTFLMPIVLAARRGARSRRRRASSSSPCSSSRPACSARSSRSTCSSSTSFWEVMLIPMYFIIGIWGGERRLYASIKFVIYTMVGSLLDARRDPLPLRPQPRRHRRLDLRLRHAARSWCCRRREQLCCFAAFALAFCIKVPLFPLHTWLPDAHVEAPTAGSVVLAAVMLKFGTYGLLRFAMPLFPDAFVALRAAARHARGHRHHLRLARRVRAEGRQEAHRLLVGGAPRLRACSASAMWNVKAVDGAMIVNLAHGISTGGLFLCIGVIYERRHTRQHRRVRRPRDDHAALLRRVPGDDAGVGRPARHVGLRRRVPDAHRHRSTPTRPGRSLGILFPHPKALTGVATPA